MKLKNKKILVYGLGVSGNATINFLLEKQAKVFFYDDNKDVLKNFKNNQVEKFELSKHLKEIVLVVIAPGIYDSSYLKIFETLKIKIINEVELASRFVSKSKIIAITGTNGKTTTTRLVEKLLVEAGHKATACGNIGISFLENLNKDEEGHFFVVEISSFQLERTKYFKPYISVVLNISPDHLNRHKTMKAYENLKFSISKKQGKKDYIILNALLEEKAKKANNLKSKILLFGSGKSVVYIDESHIVLFEQSYISLSEIGVSPTEILDNFFVLILIGVLLKIKKQTIVKVIKSFKSERHRIEKVGIFDEIEFINDSKATNPSSTIFALRKLNNSNIILLLGGQNKDFDFKEVFYCRNHFKEVICFGESAGQILVAAKHVGFENISKEKTLFAAVKKAFKTSKKGDTVLLSPACASFDEFKSYKDRGEYFKRLINAEYKKKKK